MILFYLKNSKNNSYWFSRIVRTLTPEAKAPRNTALADDRLFGLGSAIY